MKRRGNKLRLATSWSALRIGRFLALLVALCAPLSAQFSGPALKMPSQANQVQTPTNDPALLQTSSGDLVIAQGDVLTVRIFGSADFVPTVKVGADGTVSLPLIGTVPVAAMTVEHAADLIAKRLVSAGMYVNPQVSVQVSSATEQFVTVGGEMHAIVPITGDRRLLDILAVAGGLPLNASHVLTIQRPGVAKPIVVDLGTDPLRSEESNIPILARDTILVSRVGLVYVIGAFAHQGAIPLDQTSPLTLIQATSLSGGRGFEGRYEDLRIIRTEGLQRKVVRVDLKRILTGRDPDPILQADDVVFLPSNIVKAALKGGGLSVLSSLIDVGIIAVR